MSENLIFDQISFSYDGSGEEIFSELNLQFSPGWTGIVGANGSGKTTLLQLAAGLLRPDSGNIIRPKSVLHCPQRTDNPPKLLEDFLLLDTPLARQLFGRLELGADYLYRWDTLSHGERKRVQIAVALWQQPQLLAIDEPSNHIDSNARQLLEQSLSQYTGIGLLVSHDRHLLDILCGHCAMIDPPTVTMRTGNFSSASLEHAREIEQLRTERQSHRKALGNIKREMAKRREKAANEHKVRSKRGIGRKDHDAKAKIDAARIADSKAGASMRQLSGRIGQLQQKLDSVAVKKQYELGIFMPDCKSQRDFLMRIDEGEISLDGDTSISTNIPNARKLIYPRLEITPEDRIAITGANGCGKSTLLKFILPQLLIEPEKLLYMPQEIDMSNSAAILSKAHKLPHNQLGDTMTIIRRLGSDPTRILETSSPSPGELRKLMLAMGIARQVHLIIMDEPTNHLDLPSVQCLEQALQPCPCAMLLVSHDMQFLGKLTQKQWDIQPAAQPGDSQLIIRNEF